LFQYNIFKEKGIFDVFLNPYNHYKSYANNNNEANK
jgi:hypothetical protein